MPDARDSVSNSPRLGRYELLGELGHGGMAKVYRARVAGPMGFEKTLVVKQILPHLSDEPQFVEMFLSEARLAAQLNHPNIVQIFDFGEADGAYFLAMEYIDGPNLRALMRRAHAAGRPLPLPHCAKLVSAICEGLTYAHEFADPFSGEPLGLVHRDVSPDNILLARTGAVKVVDFGIAKATNQVHQTRVGTLKGKVPYMAPEQLRNEPLDLRIDIYALGVVLYELVAGRKPFEASSEVALMNAILHEPFTPVSDRRADVPEPLRYIIERALAKDREERYQSCREMQADLERFLLGSGQSVGAFQLAELISQLSMPSGMSAPIGTPVSGNGSKPRRSQLGVVVPSMPTRPPPPPPEDSLSAPRSRVLEVEPPTEAHIVSHVSLARVPPQRRWVLPAVGAALLLVAGGVALVSVSRPREPSSPAVSAMAVAAAAPTPAPLPTPPAEVLASSSQVVAPPKPEAVEPPAREEPPAEEIELHIQVVPRGAVVQLDGEVLPSNPYTGSFPRDGAVHQLRVSAAGFTPLVKELRFEKDLMLELNLQRRSVEVRRERVSKTRAPAPSPQPTAAPADDGFSELPSKPAAVSGKAKRGLDADNPWSGGDKRGLDGEDPWNGGSRKLDSNNPWKE
ncbi:serine/threonine protein kinase [Archangium lipolyticum]|uniref:serine/threonine protein kinase n=1 Tax=Archangium lipolyticum TaxID=2970465 RepID=UPI002149AAE1|nr:serine/threonine-protein kinase [Archangium lipolyticum]